MVQRIFPRRCEVQRPVLRNEKGSLENAVGFLRRARDEGRLDREAALIGRARLLVIDELGFLPLDPDGARLLFQVFAAAYERQSVVITTNLEFSRWGAVFGDDQMAAAAFDRIVHHGRLVQFRGESYRVRNALMQEGWVLKKGAQGGCSNCSNPDDHSAQRLLTKHKSPGRHSSNVRLCPSGSGSRPSAWVCAGRCRRRGRQATLAVPASGVGAVLA